MEQGKVGDRVSMESERVGQSAREGVIQEGAGRRRGRALPRPLGRRPREHVLPHRRDHQDHPQDQEGGIALKRCAGGRREAAYGRFERLAAARVDPTACQ